MNMRLACIALATFGLIAEAAAQCAEPTTDELGAPIAKIVSYLDKSFPLYAGKFQVVLGQPGITMFENDNRISPKALDLLEALEKIGIITIEMNARLKKATEGSFQGWDTWFKQVEGVRAEVIVRFTDAISEYGEVKNNKVELKLIDSIEVQNVANIEFYKHGIDNLAVAYVQFSFRDVLRLKLIANVRKGVLPSCFVTNDDEGRGRLVVLLKLDKFNCEWNIGTYDYGYGKSGALCSNGVQSIVSKIPAQ